MKNQNAKNKLVFNKSVVTDLNNTELMNVKGGTSSMNFGTTSLLLVTLLQNVD
jgi:hypothetical protein